jgi:hypothetical protein
MRTLILGIAAVAAAASAVAPAQGARHPNKPATADVAVVAASFPRAVQNGEHVFLRAAVSNYGLNAARAVAFNATDSGAGYCATAPTFACPAGTTGDLTFVFFWSSQGTCTATDAGFSCSLGRIPRDGAVEISAYATVHIERPWNDAEWTASVVSLKTRDPNNLNNTVLTPIYVPH